MSQTDKDSIWHSVSEALDLAMGVKRPEDLQRYLNFFLLMLLLVTLFMCYLSPENKLLLAGFAFLLFGLFASVTWVLTELRATTSRTD